ncbi:MAG: hypothetical protein JW782_03805 [Candidatus Saganbacteria bacterium]|nr:hypothetical protein [Candidatus Saganbacteria bacterium]
MKYGAPEGRDQYYVILGLMQKYQQAICGKIGLSYDLADNTLSVDEVVYLAAIKAPADLSIAADSSVSGLNISVSRGTETIVCRFDPSSGTFSYDSDIKFADAYELDQTTGTGLVAVNDPYPAVSASGLTTGGISNYLKKEASKALAPINEYMESRRFLARQSARVVGQQYGMMMKLQNIVKEPMKRPVEPDITDIIWVSKTDGIVRIKGTADPADKVDLKIYITTPDGATRALSNNPTWMGNNWEVVNTFNKLKAGHNKINVIISKADNREVESGDASVYLGSGGEPDLILVSPRDRQVFASDELFNKMEILIKVRGRATIGTEIVIGVNSFSVVGDDSFDLSDWKVENVKEGLNQINLLASGSKGVLLNKNIIAAYGFSIKSKGLSYVLRRGDILFNGTSPDEEGIVKGHPAIPMDPDHTGIYTGDGQVTESKPLFVKTRSLNDWDNDSFYYAVQVPRLVSESDRIKVCEAVKSKVGHNYKVPIHTIPQYNLPETLAGRYCPDQGGFYCSELAFWAWSKIAAEQHFDIGIDKQDLYFPNRYKGDDNHDSVLPAYLCEKSMEARKMK